MIIVTTVEMKHQEDQMFLAKPIVEKEVCL